MIQLEKKILWAGLKSAWNCVKNISKSRWRHWQKRWNVWRILLGVDSWFHSLSLPAFFVAMAFGIAGAKILQKMWEGPYWEGVWPHLDPWDVVRLRTSSRVWNIPEKYESHGELFFFLIQKEPFGLTKAAQFKPSVPAETLMACALIGLHLMAAEGESGFSSSCGVFSPEVGGIPGVRWSVVPSVEKRFLLRK